MFVFSDVLPLSYRVLPSQAALCIRRPCGAETVTVNLVLAAGNTSPQEPLFPKEVRPAHIAWSILSFQTCKRGVRDTEVSGSCSAWV